MVHSSSSSGIFFQGEVPSQAPRNHHFGSYGIDGAASPGPSVGASSLVTEANSVQKSASINTESYMRVPASPLSFSSNNISVSGSSVLDAQSPMQEQGPRQGASSATSLARPVLDHDNINITHLQKRPRLDIKQEDITQQQVLRQIMQQQALYQQQQFLQSLPPVQRAHLLQRQQIQLREKLQEQSLQPASATNRSYDGGVCSRRLMQYLYHQRQQPADISYWRKFVSEYYSPRAKKRWCLSLCSTVGPNSLGVFSPASMDSWQCGVCGSKSGRGFEATFDILPRLNEIKFSSGVIDELWFLDLPQESRFPSGIMILEYDKAVQESIYEKLRVVHEGRLKVVFTPDLKILTWDFCSRRHEELIPRRLVAPQVNRFLQVAQKCQSTIAESGSSQVSQQDLQMNSNMVVTAGRQLGRSLELQSLNDLGFSKTYVRSLQIAEVVNSMGDLMAFWKKTKSGPIDALKNFSGHRGEIPSIQGHPMNGGAPFGPVQAALALSNYRNMNGSTFQGLVLQNNNMNLPPCYRRFPGPVQPNHRQQLSAQGGGPAVQLQHQMVQPNLGGGPTGSNSESDLPNVSDVFQDIANELTESGFFNDDQWKA